MEHLLDNTESSKSSLTGQDVQGLLLLLLKKNRTTTFKMLFGM
jgi:hypothetical protein